MTHRPLDESWRERRAVIYGRANQASSHYGPGKKARPSDEPVAMTGKMSNRRRFYLFLFALLVALAAGTAMFGVVFAGPAPMAEPAQPPARERVDPVRPVEPVATTAQATPQVQKKTDKAPGKAAGKPATESATEAPATETESYKNCGQARKAGAAPLHAGDPGYTLALDQDADGVACEKGKD